MRNEKSAEIPKGLWKRVWGIEEMIAEWTAREKEEEMRERG